MENIKRDELIKNVFDLMVKLENDKPGIIAWALKKENTQLRAAEKRVDEAYYEDGVRFVLSINAMRIELMAANKRYNR